MRGFGFVNAQIEPLFRRITLGVALKGEKAPFGQVFAGVVRMQRDRLNLQQNRPEIVRDIEFLSC